MEKNKISKLLLKLFVSSALFIILLWKVKLGDMFTKLSAMDFRFAALVVLLIMLNYVVSSLRWKKLLIFQNADKASIWYMITLYFTGSFFNNFMPTSIGGDVYKVLKLGKKIDSKTNAFTATFMERFLGVLALCIISSVSFIQLLGWKSVLFILLGLLACLVGWKSLNFISNKVKSVKNIIDSLMKYKDRRDVLAFAFIFSFVVQLFSIFSQYFIFVSLGMHPPILYSMFILPLITLAGFFIPSLNGIGVQDALYVSLFATVGITAEVALTASILYHIMRLMVSLFGGVLYALGFDD